MVVSRLGLVKPYFDGEAASIEVCVRIDPSWWAIRGSRCVAFGLQLKFLAGLIQAGFDHRLLERSPDVLAYADAFSGSSPDSIV